MQVMQELSVNTHGFPVKDPGSIIGTVTKNMKIQTHTKQQKYTKNKTLQLDTTQVSEQ